MHNCTFIKECKIIKKSHCCIYCTKAKECEQVCPDSKKLNEAKECKMAKEVKASGS